MPSYDPFARGRFPVGVRTIRAHDAVRDRTFTCEVWYPAAASHLGQDLAPATQDSFTVPGFPAPRRQAAVRDAGAERGLHPLIAFSHHSGGPRRMATFLTTHLASHGYLVAALDHSEAFVPELGRRPDETAEQKAVRLEAVIANRVPDVRFLLDRFLEEGSWDSDARPDPTRVGLVGHSFGGWTALAVPDVEPRVRAVVALAPGGASRRKPGIIPATLRFAWGRDVPTLYLVAEDDTSLPIAGMHELFDRTPATRRMVVLRRADHMHFMDAVEAMHEAVRGMPLSGELAWLPKEMRPVADLCTGEQAHAFVRGLTLCHLDAALKDREDARRLLGVGIERELAARGIDGWEMKSPDVARHSAREP